MFFQASIGINITPSRAAIVALRQTLREIRQVGESTVALDADRPLGDQIDALASGINAFIAERGLQGAPLFMGFPSALALWREIDLPAAAGENLAETLRYEAEKYIPLPPEEIRLDYQVTARDPAARRIRVLLTVVKREDLRPYVDLASRLKGAVAGAAPGLCALAHFSQHYPGWCPRDDAALLIQTAGGLLMARLSNGQLCSGRSLPGPAPDPERARRGLGALLSDDGRESAAPPCPVCFTGGDLTEDVIRPWLPGPPEREVRPLDFDDTLAAHTDPAAVGLALRNLIKPRLDTNLLPRDFRRRPPRVAQYALVATTAMALLAGLAWGGGHVLSRRVQQRHLEGEIRRLAVEMKDLDRLQSEIDAIRARIGYLRPAGPMPLPTLDVLKTLTGLLPESAWVRELIMDGDDIRIDGYGENVSGLIPLIDASPRFTEVKFLSAITRGRDGKEKFRIGFRIADHKRADNGDGRAGGRPQTRAAK